MRTWLEYWLRRFPTALCVLMMAACSGLHSGAVHRSSDEETEVEFLIRNGTADSLATASLLAHLTQSDEEGGSGAARPDPSALILQAVLLAPDRPELIWLQLRDCEIRRCPEAPQIAARLGALDPDNGFAWLEDLRAAQGASAAEITQIIARIGIAKAPKLYWNKLAVMMFDALTHTDRSHPATAITRGADDRLTHVTGILAALDIPAIQSIARACRLDQFEQAGRRAACESLMLRLEDSDTVIAQNLSLSLRETWWPMGSPQHEAFRVRVLQERYLAVASNRARGTHSDHDAEMRVDFMRHLQREDEVERAMLGTFHEPVERPEDWQAPGAAE